MLPNFRDVGGVPCRDGRIREGLLFRSAFPRASDPEPPGVRWAGLTVVDLRGDAECGGTVHGLEGLGAAVLRVPLSPSLDPRRRQPLDMENTYREAVIADRAGLATVVQIMASASGQVLIHCAAGKDRTGLVVAALLSLAGVHRDLIVADYLRTGEHRSEVLERVSGLLSQDGDWQALGMPFDLPEPALRGVLDMWDAHSTGVDGWLGDAGASPETRARAVERLVVRR